MLPAGYHDLFEITGTVSGTLIGLLFVAVSVLPERIKGTEGVRRVKAAAALTAFTNSLAVSLFALLPETNVGSAALTVASVGLLFVAASLVSLFRDRHQDPPGVRDLLFLIGLTALFAVQLSASIRALDHPHQTGPVNTLGLLVIICFFIGIARSWELMGGPQIGITRELQEVARETFHASDAEAVTKAPEEPTE